MKKFWIVLVLCFSWVALQSTNGPPWNAIETAWAQIFTGVAQSPTRLDAATFIYTNGATQCTTAATTAANSTVTIPAPQGQGQSIYITGVYGRVSQNASTGVIQAVYLSASNLNSVSGAAPVWDLNETPNTTGFSYSFSELYPTGLKSTSPNTAVVFTPSANMATGVYLCYRVAGFYAN